MPRINPLYVMVLWAVVVFSHFAESSDYPCPREVLSMSEVDVQKFYAQFGTYEALESYFFGYFNGDSLSEKADVIVNYARHSDVIRKTYPEFYSFESVQKVYSQLEEIPLHEQDCGLLYQIVTQYIVEDDWSFTPEQKRYFIQRCIDRFLRDVESDNPEIIDVAFDELGWNFGSYISEKTVSKLVKKYLDLEKFKRMDWFYCHNIPEDFLGQTYDEPFEEEWYFDEFVIQDYVEELPQERRIVVHQALGTCNLLRQTLAMKDDVIPLLQEIVNLKMLIISEAECTLSFYTKEIPEKQHLQIMMFRRE